MILSEIYINFNEIMDCEIISNNENNNKIIDSEEEDIDRKERIIHYNTKENLIKIIDPQYSELSALILAAGLIDGNGNINIATINNRWIRVLNGQNRQGQPRLETIVNIVPSLRTQYYMRRPGNWRTARTNAVNGAFSNLYRLAMRTYDNILILEMIKEILYQQ
ncbi:hypothetical protein H8356DRAFT_1090501 [Neocallimastix lanati (nom. inval.)]|nr:hypothetical protein H8356DRAFT_1090501 [Neocallimastix sp. JGI-2020a]